MSPALAGRFLPTGPPRKYEGLFLKAHEDEEERRSQRKRLGDLNADVQRGEIVS